MESSTKKVFDFIIRFALTPIISGMVIAFSVIYTIYTLIGIIVIPPQVIRFLWLIMIDVIKSAYENKNLSPVFIDTLYELLKKFMQFYAQLYHIPCALWRPAEERPSDIKSILAYEWKIINTNKPLTALIYLLLLLSIIMGIVVPFKIAYKYLLSHKTEAVEVKSSNNVLAQSLVEPTQIVKPEPHFLYGKGMGMLTIYTDCVDSCIEDCADSGAADVSIDGVYAGDLSDYVYDELNCGDQDALNKIVISGKHHVEIEANNTEDSRDFYVLVPENKCVIAKVNCSE